MNVKAKMYALKPKRSPNVDFSVKQHRNIDL